MPGCRRAGPDEYGGSARLPRAAGWREVRFAAEAALASARGDPARVWSPLREALAEVMSTAGLVRRVGTNLNQAVARLNAAGQPGGDLVPAAQFCVRVLGRLEPERYRDGRRDFRRVTGLLTL